MSGLLVHQVRVEQRMFWRNHSGVFFTFVLPLLLLGFLGTFADGDVLVTGVACLVVVSTSFQGLCISLAFHREQGVLKRMLATPLPPALFLAGKVLSIVIVALLEVVIIIAAGVLVFGVDVPHSLPALAVALFLGAAAFAALAFAVAGQLKGGDTAPAVSNAIYLPLLFVSGVFYPVEELPAPFEVVAWLSPLYHLVEPVRSAWLGEGGAWWLHIAVLAAFTIVVATWAVRSFRWEPADEL